LKTVSTFFITIEHAELKLMIHLLPTSSKGGSHQDTALTFLKSMLKCNIIEILMIRIAKAVIAKLNNSKKDEAWPPSPWERE
jgi:hypothetical protein